MITSSRSAHDSLAWGREIVEPALRAAVESLPPAMRRISKYHFGWQDLDGENVDDGGGKVLRPTLVLLAARAAGGDPAGAISAAVSVELVHNFSLLHDDVMDGDTTRRHRPTAWSVFGIGPAVLAGDSLVTLAFSVLASSGHPCAKDAACLLSAAVQDLVEGQSADLLFEQQSGVTVAECVSMVQGKTGALFGGACELGAGFAGAPADVLARLRSFGTLLGLAFQHTDDLLGIWGDPEVTGKAVYADLARRKKSLPVVWALESGTVEGRALAELYRRPELSDDELVRAATYVEAAGGREWSRTQVAELLGQALDALAHPGIDPDAASELGCLAEWVTRRTH